MKKLYKWLAVSSLIAPVTIAISAKVVTDNFKTNNDSEENLNSSNNIGSASETNANDEPNQDQDFDVIEVSKSLKEQLNKLPLYSPLYRKDAYDSFFSQLEKEYTKYQSNGTTEEEFKKQVAALKEFYSKVFNLHLILQINDQIELTQKIKELRDIKNSILKQSDGKYQLSFGGFKEINASLLKSYALVVESEYQKEHPANPEPNTEEEQDPSKNSSSNEQEQQEENQSQENQTNETTSESKQTDSENVSLEDNQDASKTQKANEEESKQTNSTSDNQQSETDSDAIEK